MIELIELRCSNCGGLLSFESTKTANCPYCGSSFMISETKHIVSSVANDIKEAEYVMQYFGDYKGAYKKFLEIIESEPSNYRGYLGILKAMTKCFTDASCHKRYSIEQLNEYIRRLYITAGDEKLDLYRQTIDSFMQKVSENIRLSRELDIVDAKLIKLNDELQDMQKYLPNLPEVISIIKSNHRRDILRFILTHIPIWINVISLVWLSVVSATMPEPDEYIYLPVFLMITSFFVAVIMICSRSVWWIWHISNPAPIIKKAQQDYDNNATSISELNAQIRETEQRKAGLLSQIDSISQMKKS